MHSARVQLERFSALLQETREQLNAEPLHTTNDLSLQLFGRQPPATSVAPPPGHQGARPPGSAMDMTQQMAEIQATVRYGGFVESLDLSESDATEISDAITSVFIERVEASRQRSIGSGGDQLERLTSSTCVREHLEEVLSPSQPTHFDAYEADFIQMQQRNTFTQEITQYAPDLTAENQELVLGTVTEHPGLGLQENINAQDDGITETQRHLMALTMAMARDELVSKPDQEQMIEASKFLNRVQSGMVQSQTMNEAMNEALDVH